MFSYISKNTPGTGECDKRELPHTSLNSNEKLSIANKLALGVPLNDDGKCKCVKKIGKTCTYKVPYKKYS